MKTLHTPEPWQINGRDTYTGAPAEIAGPDFSSICAMYRKNLNNTANAERIVACVNACKGINPESVPEMLAALRSAEAEIRRLHNLHVDTFEGKVGEPDLEVADAARDALAKATGEGK